MRMYSSILASVLAYIMHTSVLQILYLRRSPTQNFPPKAGTGWSHWRSVIDTPAPQVREHSLHGPQSLQPPWIASGRSPIVTHCWFKHHCNSSNTLFLKFCGNSCFHCLSHRSRSSMLWFQPVGGAVINTEVMILCHLVGPIVQYTSQTVRHKLDYG